jgi:hypothetical protein
VLRRNDLPLRTAATTAGYGPAVAPASRRAVLIAVGMPISEHPPHRTGRAAFPHPAPTNREFFAALQGIKSGDQGNFRPDQGKRPSARVLPVTGGTEDRCAYRRPGALPVNPARRNASAIASPLAGAELFRPARASAGRGRLSDPVGAISARAMVGRASRA